MMMKRLMLVVAVAALASGCSSMPKVQPWEKGNLANKEMAFDPDTLETRFADHTYFSKEGASGGAGVGGGGCGCN
jgi:opacity protein-like surface antigen